MFHVQKTNKYYIHFCFYTVCHEIDIVCIIYSSEIVAKQQNAILKRTLQTPGILY